MAERALAFIVQNNHILMVKEHVKRGDLVWKFPGGKKEKDEDLVQTCEREVLEETGYQIKVGEILYQTAKKTIYLATIVGEDHQYLDIEDNEDIISVHWLPLTDPSWWDDYTQPIIDAYLQR